MTFTQPATGWTAPPMTGLAAEIATGVVTTVRQAAAGAPRSQQRVIGPSEIGVPCVRRLAYRLMDWPAANTASDPWAATIGTAVHTWMADVYTAENRRLGRERYKVEQRLHIQGNIYGSADLYDRDLRVNNDWKIVGLDRLKDYRSKGPGAQYEIQAHLYGLGQENAGEHPEHVAITFLPRGGRIDGLHVWTAPYDRSVALAALERLTNVTGVLMGLEPDKDPGAWQYFPATESYCTYCPFFLPGSTDLSKGCPGAPTDK
jgi:hypothetical protein